MKELRYQVYAEDKNTGEILPLSPVCPKEFAETLLVAMLPKMNMGMLQNFTHPHIAAVL